MAYSTYSLSHDAKKGTKGVHANIYAFVAETSVIEPAQGVLGSLVGIVSNSASSITGTASSSGTTVTGTGTAFTTELTVGDIINDNSDATSARVVTAIDSDTSLTVSSAFSSALSGATVDKKATVYFTGEVEQLRPFTGILSFKESLNKDALVADEPELVSLVD